MYLCESVWLTYLLIDFSFFPSFLLNTSIWLTHSFISLDSPWSHKILLLFYFYFFNIWKDSVYSHFKLFQVIIILFLSLSLSLLLFFFCLCFLLLSAPSYFLYIYDLTTFPSPIVFLFFFFFFTPFLIICVLNNL